MDLSGSIVWHACIFRRFTDLSGIIRLWSTQCHSLTVGEHSPDGKTKRWHCHFAIEAPTVKMDTMKKQARTCLDSLGVDKKTGQYWLTDEVMSGEHKGKKQTMFHLIPYITKGTVFNIKYQHNVTNDYVEEAAARWKSKGQDDPAPASAPPRKEKTPKVPYQQQIIAIATAEWIKFKKSDSYIGAATVVDSSGQDLTLHLDDKTKLFDIVCSAMRECSRGVNEYLVTDIARAVLYDDLDYRTYVLKKLISNTKL